MNIEKNHDWCCCQSSTLQQQQLQESISRKYLLPKDYTHLTTTPNRNTYQESTPFKHVFNFRSNQCRVVSPSKPTIPNFLSVVPKESLLTLSKSQTKGFKQYSTKTTLLKIETCSNPLNFIAKKVTTNEVKSPNSLSYFDPQVHTSGVRTLSPKVKFTLSNPAVSKMQGKRIKTAEEQTEYSSKHSQVYFKNTSEPYDNASSFYRNNLGQPQKSVNFQQYQQSDKFHSFIQFPSCREVSAHEEVDHELSNQLLQNARTLQTIVTSNERRSRQPSSPCHFITNNREISYDTPVNSEKTSAFPSINDISHKSQLQSIYQTPKSNLYHETPQYSQLNLSPTFLNKRPFSPRAQSNMFYSNQLFKEKTNSPKISVLHIEEKDNSQEEELRDKIDHNFLKSQHLSRTNSPLISINQSLKNLTEDKRSVNFQFSPIHSREASKEGQNCNFKKTLSQLKRTKTVESLQSSASQHSYLDMKFIQKHRSRRGVSKLV